MTCSSSGFCLALRPAHSHSSLMDHDGNILFTHLGSFQSNFLSMDFNNGTDNSVSEGNFPVLSLELIKFLYMTCLPALITLTGSLSQHNTPKLQEISMFSGTLLRPFSEQMSLTSPPSARGTRKISVFSEVP